MNKETLIARWIAGDISDADFKKQMSDKDYAAYVKLRKALQLYEHTQTDVPDDVYQNIKSRISKPKQTNRRTKYVKLAISVAAVLLLFISVNHFLSPSIFSVETAYGESQKVELPDGSEVWLGTHSKLSYNKEKWQKNRAVKLIGSAYFEVKKGQKFEVITPNGNVSVLGTKFQVKSIADLFKTVCFEGKVLVHTLKKDIVLKAGESVQKYDHQLLKQPVRYNQSDIQSKTTRFAQTPLAYVLKEFENQYNVKFKNQGVDTQILFTGSLPHNNLKLGLELVSKALSFKYKLDKNKTIIIKH